MNPTKRKAAIRCAVYSRVSTDAQERDGTSLDTQERACVEYARIAAWNVVARVRDSASGFSLERPGLDHLRGLAARGEVDVILAHALDRLSRKQTHIAILVEEMEERGVAIDFVTEKFEDTATGQLLRSVKAFAAELEREKIAERTMRGKAERARSGRLPQATGRGIYGYRYQRETGCREIQQEEAAVVTRVFEAFVGGDSISGIAKALNDDSVPTLQGGRWHPASVFHLLQNETYTGRTTYRRMKATRVRDPVTGKKRRKVSIRPENEWIDVPGATPAIVSIQLFGAAQAGLRDPERLRHGRRKSTYGLAGRIKCIRCGASMVGQTLRGSYRYYRCRRAFTGSADDRCPTRYVRSDRLESSLLVEIASMLSRPDVVLEELKRRTDSTRPRSRDSMAADLATLERQRTRLLKLYQLGEIDDEYLERELQQIRTKRDSLACESRTTEGRPIALPRSSDLARMCQDVSAWVKERGNAELPLIARALQLAVRAGTDATEVTGVIPSYAPLSEHADVRPVVTKG